MKRFLARLILGKRALEKCGTCKAERWEHVEGEPCPTESRDSWGE